MSRSFRTRGSSQTDSSSSERIDGAMPDAKGLKLREVHRDISGNIISGIRQKDGAQVNYQTNGLDALKQPTPDFVNAFPKSAAVATMKPAAPFRAIPSRPAPTGADNPFSGDVQLGVNGGMNRVTSPTAGASTVTASPVAPAAPVAGGVAPAVPVAAPGVSPGVPVPAAPPAPSTPIAPVAAAPAPAVGPISPRPAPPGLTTQVGQYGIQSGKSTTEGSNITSPYGTVSLMSAGNTALARLKANSDASKTQPTPISLDGVKVTQGGQPIPPPAPTPVANNTPWLAPQPPVSAQSRANDLASAENANSNPNRSTAPVTPASSSTADDDDPNKIKRRGSPTAGSQGSTITGSGPKAPSANDDPDEDGPAT